MTTTDARLRIEIFDPLADPPMSGESAAVVYAAPPLRHEAPLWESAQRRIEWTTRLAEAVVHRLAHRRIQARHDGHPRRDSRVRQHVFLPFADARCRLPGPGTVLAAGRARLELLTVFEPIEGGAIQARATLTLPGSWPRLPVSITVEPWWRSRTVATVALRSTRRIRYPRRYFGAAHSAVRELGAMVTRSA